MRNSLTYAPVSRGVALLETGAPQPELAPGLNTGIIEFAELARAESSANGAFSLCVPGPVSTPAVLVFTAMDGAGKEYAPLVQSAFDTSGKLLSDLGPLSIGECYISCDISGGVESDLPVVIEGNITSTPAARAGIVGAEVGIPPLDHTQTVWSVVIPGLGTGETNAFQTAPQTSGCAGLCAPYRFTLPTRAPIMQGLYTLTGTGPSGPVSAPVSSQERGFDAYVIYATTSGCKYPFAGAATTSDKKSPLLATPGATLQARDAPFTDCR